MKFLVVCVLIVASVVRADYPAEFPKCKNGDASCLTKAANEIVPKYFAGFREVNLIPYDPLHVKSLSVERNTESPVNVDLTFKDLDLIGLKNLIVKSFKGLNADFSGRTELEAVIPEVQLKGGYHMDGRILLLPIVGDGPCVITLKNVHVLFSTDLKPVEKNGHKHATLEHVKLELEVGSVHFQLDNLFNGDKALGESTNKVINDSSKEVFNELKPGLSKALALIVKQIVNGFFEKYPYEEYFL